MDRVNSKQGGGTGILIKKNIKFKSIQPVSVPSSSHFEYTAIEIKLQKTLKLFIISAYATSTNKAVITPELKTLFNTLQLHKPNHYYLLAGDLNAKHTDWGNPSKNDRGTSLQRWITEDQIKFRLSVRRPKLPTFPKSGAFIDLCIADNRIQFLNLSGSNTLRSFDYDSDHRGSIMEISISTLEHLIIEETSLPIRYNFSHTNWNKFHKFLSDNDNTNIPNNTNISITEIDTQLARLNSQIVNAIEHSTPLIQTHYNSTEKYITPKIKKLRKQKSSLITQINNLSRIQNYSPQNDNLLTTLKTLLKEIKHEIKKAFHESVNTHWKNKITNISLKNPRNCFPTINQIFRKKESNSLESLKITPNNSNLISKANIDRNNLTPDSHNNLIITNHEDLLNILGTHFESIHTQNDSMGSKPFSSIVNHEARKIEQDLSRDRENNSTLCTFTSTNTADQPDKDSIPLNFFTNTHKLKNTFKNLNSKKSASFDSIPNIVLKNLPLRYINHYTILFNNCLNIAYFPRAWKTAKVIAIKKKGKDGSDPINYRPISLLPNISKVFETVVNDSIAQFCSLHNIIPETQFGFRFQHRDCVAALLIDLEKAFDTVWLDGLFYKLAKKKFPHHLIKIIWDMTHGKKFFVSDKQSTSTKRFSVNNGLQQGTVNSPILFNIYLSDLLQMFGINSENNKRGIAFADDLVIYLQNPKPSLLKNQMQELFHKIQIYLSNWKLKININKCETILFRPPISKNSGANSDVCQNSKKFQITDRTNPDIKIPHKRTVRYLGIHLDYNLNFKEHIESQIEKAQKSFLGSRQLFYSKNLDKSVKLPCYKLFIRSILTYACPIWFNVNASLMEKLRIFERKCIRAYLNMYRCPKTNYKKMIRNDILYEHAKLIRIDLFILRLIRNHWASTRNIKSNSLIYSSTYPNPLYFETAMNSGYIPPQAFLYLDNLELIQNSNNIPIIYHYARKMTDKRIKYNKNCAQVTSDMRFLHKLTKYNLKDNHRKNTKKYWLL
ncbi:uncharacterized protein LOC143431798 [Xylocopa sonorina]|uniref:uncharacterized protein LOC143431798 n=1 Tax=Xylocopa sonorina TaxID=1818115 RepID=UPI00403A850D